MVQDKEGGKLMVTKIFEFSAAHRLYDPKIPPEENLKRYGKCSRLHGHNYVLEVSVEGDVDESGMVMNFEDIGREVGRVIEKLDHSYLNGIVDLPTCERLLIWISSQLAPRLKIKKLKLYETPRCFAEMEVG